MKIESIPENWREFLAGKVPEEYWQVPAAAAAARRAEQEVYPPEGKIFRALELTAPEAVRAVITGQDPYHEPGQAEGLAFSVPAGMPLPPSLRNIFTEYAADLHRPVPESGHLGAWAAGGVLLLNSLLTVDAGAAGSHRNYGWERFTDGVIAALAARPQRTLFLLWGNYAIRKKRLIPAHQPVLTGVHPSPLSAYRGWFGSRPFSRAEALLGDWHWPEL